MGAEGGAVGRPEACACVTDPFTGVPAELRLRPKKKGSVRHVKSASCGKEECTNRQSWLRLDCEKLPVQCSDTVEHGARRRPLRSCTRGRESTLEDAMSLYLTLLCGHCASLVRYLSAHVLMRLVRAFSYSLMAQTRVLLQA